MLEFLRPIVVFNTWIYIALGLVALFFIRLMWLARKDRARSIFTLERENTRARLARAFTGLMVVLSLMLGIYYLSIVTPPMLPPPPDTPTPTPMVALPPTPTPPPLLPTPTPIPTLMPTPTAFIQEMTTPAAPPPAQGQPANCPRPGVKISQPGDGAVAIGVIQISGAAIIDNFDYYKFEFRAPGGDWNFIQRYSNPVPDGVLGSWNSDTVPPGQYEFRLMVVDKIGNYPNPCVIRLAVQ